MAGKLNVLLGNLYINNIYAIDDNRFTLVAKGSESIAVNIDLNLGIWVSQEVPVDRVSNESITTIKKLISGDRIIGVNSPKGERIIIFDLLRGKLVVELFGRGNMIILDGDSTIRFALVEQVYRDRALLPGKRYSLPPPRGIPFIEVGSSQIDFNSSMPLAKYLGTRISAPRKFIDELLYMLSLDPMRPADSLSLVERKVLVDSAADMVKQIISSDELYVYPGEDGKPLVISFIRLSHLGEVEPLGDLLSSMSEIFQRLSVGAAEKEEARHQAEVQAQKRALSAQLERAKTLRELAGTLMTGDYKLASDMARKAGYTFDDDQVIIDGIIVDPRNLSSSASKIYDLAKEVETGSQKLNTAIKKLESSIITAPRHNRTRVLQARKWYETYRWIYTTDGSLAVGGKDASGNIALLKRRMEVGDLVFHADVPGSPFFILKGKPSDVALVEVATATISFSRAWREGFLAGDVYYVDASQVSTSAPSGQYLARGSAMIYGEKKYIKGVRLSLGLGFLHEDEVLKAYCAPILSADHYCDYYVEISPGRLTQSAAAKKIFNMLSPYYDKNKPTMDDIQRSLPAGNSDVIGFRKGKRFVK